MIHLDTEYLKEIRLILRSHFPEVEVRVFGSRVNGDPQKYSDLDLVLVASEKLDWRKIERLKDAFSESDLPILVDVHDWHTLSDQFKAIINKKYEVLQPGNVDSQKNGFTG